MSEEQQLVVVMLKSTGVGLREIQAAMKHGLSDYEAISEFVAKSRKEREE